MQDKMYGLLEKIYTELNIFRQETNDRFENIENRIGNLEGKVENIENRIGNLE
ncbi:hypothetical protein SAMN02744037_02536, partial [Tepidibacter formicigenes DSM 15518]